MNLKKILPGTVLFLSLALLAACSAQAPASRQVQLTGGGMSKLLVGDLTVYAIQDAPGSMDISLFSGPLTPERRASFMPGGSAPASVNVFLLQGRGNTVLVDTGWGKDGRVRGRMLERLAALGLAPEDIDFVLLTHMHGDHIYGLLDGGEAVFPRATVMVALPEGMYWLSDEAWEGPRTRAGAELATAVSRAYDGRFRLVEYDTAVLPGIRILDASGHTPGHAAFLVGDGKDVQPLLITGDLIHAAALQFPNPEECASYDMDPVKAASTRRAYLDMAVEKDWIFAGMHLPFSGLGTVSRDSGEGYAFTPLPGQGQNGAPAAE